SLGSSYKTVAPGAPLRETIHRYFVLVNAGSVDENSIYILPDNSAHLIFYLFKFKNEVFPVWNVIGPRSAHQVISRRHRLFTFICTFKPGGIRSLVNVPLNELRDLPVNASEVLRKYDPRIFEQLTRHAMRFDIGGFVNHLEVFLRSAMMPTHPVVG